MVTLVNIMAVDAGKILKMPAEFIFFSCILNQNYN